MKQFTKAIALLLSLALILCFPVGASAAEPENATIDTAAKAIHIQANRELLTLLTCHPPASGGKQRYLVFCERIDNMEVS